MNEQQKKCNGYESMFTFLNDEDFQKHLEICEECRKEHERMQKISNIVQEARPYFRQKQKKKVMMRTVCAVFALATVSLSYPVFNVGFDIHEKLKSEAQEEVLTAEELGLPVDEYGFIYIN